MKATGKSSAISRGLVRLSQRHRAKGKGRSRPAQIQSNVMCQVLSEVGFDFLIQVHV